MYAIFLCPSAIVKIVNFLQYGSCGVVFSVPFAARDAGPYDFSAESVICGHKLLRIDHFHCSLIYEPWIWFYTIAILLNLGETATDLPFGAFPEVRNRRLSK